MVKKKLGILELLGIAVANIGMPYNDFCAITPEEFSYIYNAYNEKQQELYKDNWERMRMLAYIGIQPYAKKGLTPHKLLPFSWDVMTHQSPKVDYISKDEALRMFEKTMERISPPRRSSRDIK